MACYGLFCLVLVDGDLRVCEYFTDKISVSFSVCLSHCLFLSLSLSLSLSPFFLVSSSLFLCLSPPCLSDSVCPYVCLSPVFLSVCLSGALVCVKIHTDQQVFVYLCISVWEGVGVGGWGLTHACLCVCIHISLYV